MALFKTKSTQRLSNPYLAERRLPRSPFHHATLFGLSIGGAILSLWRLQGNNNEHPATAPNPKALLQQWDDGRPPGHLFDPVEIPPRCPRGRRRRVIDMTFVNNELSSLELRLNELWNVVDVFVIAESTVPFKPDAPSKPLYLAERWDDFERFHAKMVHVVLPPEISEGTGAGVDLRDFRPNFKIQEAQRDELWRRIKVELDPGEDDLIIRADLDEIPRPGAIEDLACSPPRELPATPICLETKDSFYYYNYRCHIKFEWTGSPSVLQYAEYNQPYYQLPCRTRIANASTHCSSCFDSLESFHIKSVSNSEPIRHPLQQNNNASIIARVTSCRDFWLRTSMDEKMELRGSVDRGSIPIIVSNHPERWPHLLGKGPLYEPSYSHEQAVAVSASEIKSEGIRVRVPICRTAQNVCVRPYFPSPAGATCPVQDDLQTSSTGSYIIPENFSYRFDHKFANAILNVTSGSVLELGAGLGCYTYYFNRSGSFSRVSGYEGASNVYELTGGFIEHADLTEEHDFGRFNWVVCLEVAEHIPAEFEATFVDNISGPSPDGIILSWALPDQPGSGHVNGKTNEYVISLMQSRGFEYDAQKTIFLRGQAELSWFKETTMVFTANSLSTSAKN